MKAVSVAEAVAALRDGEVGLVPTETVVGLVAAQSGLERIRGIKHREPDKPVALLCSSAEQAFSLAREVPPLARRLAGLLWPGSLTLVLENAVGSTVGVRVPDHAVVRALLAEFGGPLYATSANPAGEPPPTSLEDVDEQVRAAVDFVLEGEGGGGEASAVVDLTHGRARLLRSSETLTREKLNALAAERI